MEDPRMVRLATVGHSFHARVIAARVGAEGIVTELRGGVDGPYPMGDVHIYVPEIDLPIAQELLLADEVESAFEDPDEFPTRTGPRELWLVAAALVMLTVLLFSRQF
ncbi:MAG: hypothetical protein ABR540_04750 [Acidimicrobiales bacterium]